MNLKDTYSLVFLKAAEKNTEDYNLETLRGKWWGNLRTKNEGGLRLTDEGLDFVKSDAQMKTYSIKIPKEIKITPQILIWLDQFINSPWHMVKGTITVMSEKSAFELYLFSGDIKKLGQSKAMAKRFKSELAESNS